VPISRAVDSIKNGARRFFAGVTLRQHRSGLDGVPISPWRGV
jgi:hypothetical protein